MKAKVHDSGSIKTVLVQDDNGDKFITGLEELLDMMDGEDNWEIETMNSSPLMEKLYKYNKLTREVGEIRREIESYNNSKVFPVNELFDDVEMIHIKEIVDKYLKSNELQLGTIQPYCPPIHMKEEKFPTCTTRGEGEDFIGVHTGYQIKPASKEQDYTGMKVEIDGITGTVEYTDVYDGLALRFRGKEAGFLELTPDGIKMPRFELDDTRMIGEFSRCKNIINIEVVLKYNELLKKEEREDMKGGEKEPTLDVLFVFFNVKDIEGKPVPHFMVPSLTTDNDYIMEEGCDDPASLVKKALGDYKLPAGDMEYLGWEGDTPPRITKEDVKDMVHVDDCVLVTRKVPRKLIARE